LNLLLVSRSRAQRSPRQLCNCSIVVVKLDRLSEACFHHLTDEKVRFIVAELRPPDVDPIVLHIYAALAEGTAQYSDSNPASTRGR